VTDRVEVDAKRLARLMVGLRRSDLDRVRLSLVEIVHVEVEVQLLRHGSLGPRRRDIVVDLLKSKDTPFAVEQFDPDDVVGSEVAQWLDVMTGERCIERGERERVGTVKSGHAKSETCGDLRGHRYCSGCSPPRIIIMVVPLTGSVKMQMALPGTGISSTMMAPPWRVMMSRARSSESTT
jgi:hypothetical protein